MFDAVRSSLVFLFTIAVRKISERRDSRAPRDYRLRFSGPWLPPVDGGINRRIAQSTIEEPIAESRNGPTIDPMGDSDNQRINRRLIRRPNESAGHAIRRSPGRPMRRSEINESMGERNNQAAKYESIPSNESNNTAKSQSPMHTTRRSTDQPVDAPNRYTKRRTAGPMCRSNSVSIVAFLRGLKSSGILILTHRSMARWLIRRFVDSPTDLYTGWPIARCRRIANLPF